MSSITERAREASASMLQGLPLRIAHVAGVASVAVEVVDAGVVAANADELVAAAWLHDIGYAAAVVSTGFHPLDGARFLRRAGFSELVVSLVAHHTGAAVEAEERGLSAELAEIPEPPRALLDVLTFADVVTAPDGSRVEPADRLAEILDRYESTDPVHRAVTRSGPSLLASVSRVQKLLDDVRRRTQPM